MFCFVFFHYCAIFMVFWYSCVRVVCSFKVVAGCITGYWFYLYFHARVNATLHPRPCVYGRRRGSEARYERACMHAGIVAFPAEGILTRHSQQKGASFLWNSALTLLRLLEYANASVLYAETLQRNS